MAVALEPVRPDGRSSRLCLSTPPDSGSRRLVKGTPSGAPDDPARRDFLGFAGRLVTGAAIAPLIAPLAACDPREFARDRGATLRISIAAGNVGGVFYPYAGGIAAAITRHVPRVAATAEVSGGTIDNMHFIRRGTADLAFATADMLDEAYRGAGEFEATGRVPVRTLAMLYYSYLHIATLAHTGITTLGGLRGKVVSVGSPGSSTEVIALRVMRAAGLEPGRDVRTQNLNVGAAADALRDGKLDAFIWIGGVPTGAVLELASSPSRRLVLIESASALPAIAAAHGGAPYVPQIIRAGGYPGLTTDVPVLGLANLLVADARMADDLAYEITRALLEHRDDVSSVHAEARHLAPELAVTGSPIPYHGGAERYYREAGVWPA